MAYQVLFQKYLNSYSEAVYIPKTEFSKIILIISCLLNWLLMTCFCDLQEGFGSREILEKVVLTLFPCFQLHTLFSIFYLSAVLSFWIYSKILGIMSHLSYFWSNNIIISESAFALSTFHHSNKINFWKLLAVKFF